MNDPVDPVAFGRLEGKVDSILTLLIPKLDDHDKRIGSLERSRARAIGFAGGIGAVAGYIGSWLKAKGLL